MEGAQNPWLVVRIERAASFWVASGILLCLAVACLAGQQTEDQKRQEKLRRCEIELTEATEAAESFANAGDQSPEERVKLLTSAGSLCSQAGQYAKAEPFLRKALAVEEETVGTDHPRTATALSTLAGALYRKGDYAAAQPLYRRALVIQEKVLGPEYPDTALTLNNLAELLTAKGDYAGAEPLYRRALTIREKALGAEHPDTAQSLNDLALLLRRKGDYATAEPLCRRSLAIREKVLGPEHPDTATSLINLASLLRQEGDYATAEPLCRRSLAIREKALGPEHPDTAQSLNNLASLLEAKGDYVASEALYRRSLTIREKVLGPEHPDIVTPLNNLAELLMRKGDYTAAEPFYRRALAVQEKVLGPQHPDTATLLNNLASLLDAKGDYAAAEPLYRRALAIQEKVLGPEHPATTTPLNNLASLLEAKGDYAAAEPLYRRALAIQEKVLGPEHPDTAKLLNNLASLLSQTGDYATAEPLCRRALAIQERVLGLEDPDTAASLGNLALLLTTKGDYTAAEPLYRRSLAIQEKVLGPVHPTTAASLNNLALLLGKKGDYVTAEPLYRRALAITEKVLGPEHPDTVLSLYNLVGVLWAEGRYTEAQPLLARASRAQARNLSRWLMPFNEAEQRGFLQSLQPVDVFASFQSSQPQSREVESEALWAVLQRKGRLQEIRALQQRLARRQPELFERWLVRQRALEVCVAPALPDSPLTYSDRRPLCASSGPDFAARQRSASEALQALYAAVPREEQDLGVVELEDLRGLLSEGGWTLIEIANYRVFQPGRPFKDTLGEKRYAAYVLFADGRIESADLGSAEEIDKIVAKLRGLEADRTSKLSAVREAARELYEQTLGKLEEKLKGHSKLYVAADGDLGLVDFSSLVDRKGRWFIEDHLVVNLTSGRDLVRLKREESAVKGGRGDYLVANPSFLFRNDRVAKASSGQAANSTKPTLSAPAFSCSAAFGKGASWSRVGVTREQVGSFRTALPGLRVYEREQASESAVKQINRPRTLWFITHGFFCENAAAERGADSLGGRTPRPGARTWDDPIARGALVLAGAQVGGTGDGEDGFLQGSEIVERDWEGTDLVVLGACETALGVPSVGDGVYGMRRALALAGVRSQVMTLWSVSQTQTFELLQTFANLLRQGEGKAEALRQAQRQMLKKYPHPYYWAGFHFTGDPGALGTR